MSESKRTAEKKITYSKPASEIGNRYFEVRSPSNWSLGLLIASPRMQFVLGHLLADPYRASKSARGLVSVRLSPIGIVYISIINIIRLIKKENKKRYFIEKI